MKIFKRLSFLVLLLLIGTVIYNYPKLNMITGYASKNMASTLFISERSAASVNSNDNNMPLIDLAKTEPFKDKAIATVYGLMERETVCREGLGCVLINDEFDPNAPVLRPNRVFKELPLPFPYGNNGVKDTVFDEVDYQQLDNALDIAFANADVQKTRTALVVYKDQIIAERYGEGFDASTPILGWSMTKSITATMYGILEHQKKINVNNYFPFKEHKDNRFLGKDIRHFISLNHLLRMQSGLAWDEDYASISDVTKMLFLDTDMTMAQAKTEVIAKPTEVWNYSSGTSNYLSGVLRKQFKTHQEYLDFPYSALIDKIGMYSMLIETDMAGNFVGSSYAWATTRDWAKFGLLYLHEGNWNGEQIFDPKWAAYVKKPTRHSNGTYGAHFWLNAEGKYPDAPRDLYSANGFQGQRVFIIPSKNLVVVRTGLAGDDGFDANAFLKEVLEALPE